MGTPVRRRWLARWVIFGWAIAPLAGGSPGAAQPATPTAPPRSPSPSAPAAPGLPAPAAPAEPAVPDGGLAALSKLPASLRLGVRAAALAKAVQVNPTLVLVPDERSYFEALRGWSTDKPSTALRYPVLIDDGTWNARARIARFCHAFRPARVVRWRAPDDAPAWPEGPDERHAAMRVALAQIWGAPDPDGLRDRWKSIAFVPPGVVVTWAGDPAWTAAIALAAGRGQPLVFVQPPKANPDAYLGLDQADALAAAIAAELIKLGYGFDALGDDLDAVTLCFTTPSKVFLGDRDPKRYFALTDLIGRTIAARGRQRWAWAGQVMGTPVTCAYDAMSALFLAPTSAWLLDGYDSSPGWNQYDATAAATELRAVDVDSVVDDRPDGVGLTQLRMRAAGVRAPAAPPEGKTTPDGRTAPDAKAPPPADDDAPWQTRPHMGVDAGLISITTSGQMGEFDLKPGKALPWDIPVLRRPAIVYFVHSFSAAAPLDRRTVAGAWRDRGAYAYYGSVDEPNLAAFIPTPLVMRRLGAGLPWGAAVRIEGAEPWKVALLGDPLITFKGVGPRTARGPLPLANAEDVADALPAALKAGRFDEALWSLAWLGRGADAVRLLRALGRNGDGGLAPEAACAGISAAFFAGDYDAFLAAAAAAAPLMGDPAWVRAQGADEVRDMVWHAVWPSMPMTGEAEARLLPAYLRPENLARDVEEAIGVSDRVLGPGASKAVAEQAARLKK